jgi:HK97 family phage major capsid protein
MGTKEMEEELRSIAEKLENPEDGMDVESLSKRADELMSGIEERKAADKESAERRSAVLSSIRTRIESGGNAKVGGISFVADKAERTYDASSPEYRSAWVKTMAKRGGIRIADGDLTEAEQRAYTMLTTNSTDVVPTAVSSAIRSLVEKQTAIYADLTLNSFATIYEVPVLKAITAGDARATAEGVANDDEEDDFDHVTITGVEFKKHAHISRKMQVQSVQGFENWLTQHVARRIVLAMDAYVYTKLEDATTGIQAANKFAVTGVPTDADVCAALAATKGTGVKVYSNRKTVFTYLAQVKDADGNPIYTATAMTDPTITGALRGSGIRVDDALADGKVFFGDTSNIEANLFEDVNIEADVDVTSRVTTYGGYALFDCVLADPASWSEMTITPKA